MCIRLLRFFIAIASASLAAVPARAQLAVIDVPAIVQLIQQVQTMEQEVQTAQAQLTQAQQTLQSMTGDRGMQLLLGGVSRNYLPSSWAQLTSAMQSRAGGYSGLASDTRNAIAINAVLTPQQLAALSAANQQRIVAAREASALQQSLAQEALANASGRFASIQILIDAISGARDQKGILDLQARISAELGMLQNEQTKLQVLQQASQARQAIDRQQEREQIIAGHGKFEGRFQPAAAIPTTLALR